MSRLGALTGELDLAAVLDSSPFPYLLLSTALVVLGANAAYLRSTYRTLEDIVGQHIFDAFPLDPEGDNEESQHVVRASLQRALRLRMPDYLASVRYNIHIPHKAGDGYEARYWSVIHTPVLDDSGRVSMLYQSPIDITELVRMQAGASGANGADLDSRVAGNMFMRAQALAESNRHLDAERERLLDLFRAAPGFMGMTFGAQHVFDIVNEALYELVGRRDLLGRPVREALPELQEQGYLSLMDEVYRSGEVFVGRQMRVFFRSPAGGAVRERYVDFVNQPIRGTDHAVRGIFVQGQDVTEQKLAQDALNITNERLRLAVEGSGDGIWDWDIDSGQVVFSRRFREIFGYDEASFESHFEAWSARVHPDDLAAFRHAFDEALSTRAPAAMEFRMQCADRSWKWVRARGVVAAPDGAGRARRMGGTLTDISQQRASEETIWRQANFDALTGLPNRRLFRDRLGLEVRKAERAGASLALMFIDLDRFKEINDLLGHDAGDQLLVEASRRLSHCVRASDTVARLGGDEFTVILTMLDDLHAVDKIARKILEALSAAFWLQQQRAHVSGSIGITIYEADANTPEDLIRNADQAMYAAKNGGRNQFRYFTSSMQEDALRRLSIANDLRRAVQEGQFELYFQPVLEMATGRIAKAEALLRWHHPQRGLVEPAEFIPIAEEAGLIGEIGDWAFRQAAEASRLWSSLAGGVSQVSVNASPLQFHGSERGMDWLACLRRLGLAGSRVVVEITEGLLLNATPALATRLLAYRDAGVQIAIDDFGTGYSSIQYLKQFDIDYLKIDQSFIRDMVGDASDRTIVKSIIVMAHELGLQVIAEGIETPAQHAMLREAGCDFGQGFLFAQPLPAGEFEEMMAAQA